MTDSSISKKYWAFISYSSKDKKLGQWLHRRLESYPIPKEFQGTKLFDGAVLGKNLRPVFRDRDELSGSADLGPAILSALKESRYLIVLCSKNSAKSEWVNKEIEDFRLLDGERNILALIVDGEPNATSNPQISDDEECFPPALRYPHEPLAGDLRKEGDGKERGFLKLLAGISQIGFDALFRRHERLQRKKRLSLAMIALLIITTLICLSTFALIQRKEAVSAKDTAQSALKGEQVALQKAQTNLETAQRNEARALEEEQKAVRAAKEAEESEQRALASEGETKLTLADSDWRLAARHITLRNFPLAFAFLERSLRNDPQNHDAAQLAWSTICRSNVRFPSSEFEITSHNGQFEPQSKLLFWMTDKGQLHSFSIETGEIRHLHTLDEAEFSQDLRRIEIHATDSEIRIASHDYEEKIIHVFNRKTKATTTKKEPTVFAHNFSNRRLNEAKGAPEKLKKIFLEAKTYEELISSYLTANDEEVFTALLASGQFHELRGGPVQSIIFLKDANLLIITREGGHSVTRLIEAFSLESADRVLLARGSRDMPIGIAISPDQKHIAIQSGGDVNLIPTDSILQFPQHTEHEDPDASIANFPISIRPSAKLVCHGEIQAMSVFKANQLHLLTSEGIFEYWIPGREEHVTTEGDEQAQLFEKLQNENPYPRPELDPVLERKKKKELLPLLIESNLEAEIPSHSLYFFTTPRAVNYCEIKRNVWDYPWSRLVTLSSGGDILLDHGYSGEFVYMNTNASLAAVDHLSGHLFWCPTPEEKENPAWLADFLHAYSGTKFDPKGKLVQTSSSLKSVNEKDWFSTSWNELAKKFDYKHQ